MTPGSNLLRKALRVIGNQTLSYLQNTGRSSNEVGKLVAAFAPAVTIRGSFQPANQNKYVYLGLDLQKEYWTLYAPLPMIDVGRDVSGDQVIYKGSTFQCESATPWSSVDGWTEMLCVRISPRTGVGSV